MRYLFFCLFSIFFISSCDNHEKLTAHFGPVKETSFRVQSKKFISDVSFLFIIDYSGSMDFFYNRLAKNIQLFLEPIFHDYPYYNYNFAVTNMLESLDPKKQLTFVNKEINCKGLTPASFVQNTSVGPFLRYSHQDLQNENIDHRDLICLLSNNIQHNWGGNEFFFNSLTYIIENSDSNFKSHFFGENNFLILFFISDAWGEANEEYATLLYQNKPRAAETFSQRPFLLLNSAMEGAMKKVFSYGIVQDSKREDSCDQDETTGDEPENYPFHMYKFIEKTGGSVISICDNLWENKLINVFNDLKEAFTFPLLHLKKFPKLDTIEVFFNNKKIPKDVEQGWSFDRENLAIHIGPEFDYMAYIADKEDAQENDEFTVRYNPVNVEILAD